MYKIFSSEFNLIRFCLCLLEFSRRWCVLNDGNFSYYESDKNATPNGGLKMKEIVCLAVNPPETHG